MDEFLIVILEHFDLKASEVDLDIDLAATGFDSLMLFELFDLLEEDVGRPIATGALDSIKSMSDLLAFRRSVT